MADMSNVFFQVIDDVIKHSRVEEVSPEFINSASIIDRKGITHTLFGDDLKKFMADPQSYNCLEARVTYDIELIRRRFLGEIGALFSNLDHKVAELGIDAGSSAEPHI